MNEEKRINVLKSIGLPDAILTMAIGESPHELLESQFGLIYREPWYIYREDSKAPFGMKIVPILEEDTTVYAYSPDKEEFISFDIEAPEETLDVLGKDFSKLLARMFLHAIDFSSQFTESELIQHINELSYQTKMLQPDDFIELAKLRKNQEKFYSLWSSIENKYR